MTEEKSDIYRILQQHLDRMPIGFPPTKSGVELRLLKHLNLLFHHYMLCNLIELIRNNRCGYYHKRN